jgi:stage III sporulation protein AA
MDKLPILEILPPSLREPLTAELDETVEEIRLRSGVPVTVLRAGRERALFCRGRPVLADGELLQAVLAAAAGHSLHTVADALARGYVPLRGGSRLGVCGHAVVAGEAVRTIDPVSSLNLRVARACPGCGEPLASHLQAHEENLLLLGPPGSGKTTLLRDTVRLLSDHLDRRVGLADPRGELAALRDGVPQLDVGRRTDILADCPIRLAVPMLVRTMNPQWVCVDEITEEGDLRALSQAAYCGVRFLATAHADDVADLRHRPLYRQLLNLELFPWAAVLQPDRSVRLERLLP